MTGRDALAVQWHRALDGARTDPLFAWLVDRPWLTLVELLPSGHNGDMDLDADHC